jgi:hypothetical protein
MAALMKQIKFASFIKISSEHSWIIKLIFIKFFRTIWKIGGQMSWNRCLAESLTNIELNLNLCPKLNTTVKQRSLTIHQAKCFKIFHSHNQKLFSVKKEIHLNCTHSLCWCSILEWVLNKYVTRIIIWSRYIVILYVETLVLPHKEVRLNFMVTYWFLLLFNSSSKWRFPYFYSTI